MLLVGSGEDERQDSLNVELNKVLSFSQLVFAYLLCPTRNVKLCS